MVAEKRQMDADHCALDGRMLSQYLVQIFCDPDNKKLKRNVPI